MAKVDCVGCIHSVVCKYRSRNEQPWIKEHCKLAARDERPHGEWKTESAIDYLTEIGWLPEHDRILTERPQWIPCSERLPEENICDDGYVEPSDYVLVFGDHGQYGVSRYWGNRRTKKTNPHSFSDWMDLEWFSQKPIAWMPLPTPYRKEGEAE